MNKNERIMMKIVVVVALSILLIFLIYKDETIFQLEQPEGEQVRAADVRILLNELVRAGAKGIDKNGLNDFQDRYLNGDAENVSYGVYGRLLDCLLGEKGKSEERDKLREKITYKNKYKENFLLLKKDWYESYQQLVKYYGLSDVIKEEKVGILCSDRELAGEEKIGEGSLLGADGLVYTCVSGQFADLKFMTVKAYVHEERLLTVVEKLPDKNVLSNVWIMEAGNESIHFFYEGYEISEGVPGIIENPEQTREQVADIGYKNGEIYEVSVKKERIGGKLLGIGEDYLDVEGYGQIPIKEGCVGYKLYEDLRKADKSELALGYDFADFVLENGKLCAFLLARKDKMETIRVAIKSDDFGSLYHNMLTFTCQDDMTVYYGSYEERRQEEVTAGQEITIKQGGKYLSGDRVELVPKVNTGKIQVLSLKRSQGTPSYRGRMEVSETKDGLVLINEVLLEEYLYSVVPSEMPASYPMEALKAQAICARTYGYRYLEQPGYGQLGAHVDDSVGFQVYNNIAENMNSTKAVKETAGMLLLYEEEPVSTYYYSTSCGFGADAGIWNEDQKDKMPYLSSNYIGKEDEEGEKPIAAELSQEEIFRAYISLVDENAYEKEEAWFRWHYQVEELDVSLLYQRLKERYGAGAQKVLTFTGEGEPEKNPEGFETKEPENFQEVYDIRCLKRKEGGVMDELLLETDKGIYKVISEYNIRYILNQQGEVLRQDGTSSKSASLLPSAYLIIDVEKEGNSVVGYKIIGGGYGHGVGMSQNGARAMGAEGLDCESILSFYYKDCQIGKIY